MKKALPIIFIIFGLVFSVQLQAIMLGNESCDAFSGGTSGTSGKTGLSGTASEDPCDPGTGASASGIASINTVSKPTLGYLIAMGGGQFLQSAAYFHQFESYYELSEITGPDFKALQDNLSAAVTSLEKAAFTYRQLKEQAALTPYNQTVINRLILFDYQAFQEKKNLNSVIFSQVWHFLVVGDVRGIYNQFDNKADQILDLLYMVKEQVDAGVMADVSNVWRLNQQYAEFKLFGQYVAEVFYSLKEK